MAVQRRRGPHAGFSLFAVCQKNPEIQIVGEYDPTIFACPLHDYRVEGIMDTDKRPMDRLVVVLDQELLPSRI